MDKFRKGQTIEVGRPSMRERPKSEMLEPSALTGFVNSRPKKTDYEEERKKFKSRRVSVRLHTTEKHIDVPKAETYRPNRMSKMLSEPEVHARPVPTVTSDSAKLFGIPLEILITKNRNPLLPVPEFLIAIYKYLQDSGGMSEEGIFRVSPYGGIVDEIKWALDKGLPIQFKHFKGFNCHVASGLLKMWLRSMPEPLIPFELYENILEIFVHHEDIIMYTDLLSGVLQKMPTTHRLTLQLLIGLIRQVKQHADVNKMGTSNLAMVFSPCIMKVRNPQENPMREFTDIPKAITALSTMIDFYEMLFPDPLPPIIYEEINSIEGNIEPATLAYDKPELETKMNGRSLSTSSSENSSNMVDEDNVSGADVLRQYLQNGMSARFKPLAEEPLAEKRRSITDSDLEFPSVDSPIRVTSPVPLPMNLPETPPPPPRKERAGSMLLKNLTDLFTPKKDPPGTQNKSRASFWFYGSDTTPPVKPQPVVPTRVNQDEEALRNYLSAKRYSEPPKNKQKSRTMSFLSSF